MTGHLNGRHVLADAATIPDSPGANDTGTRNKKPRLAAGATYGEGCPRNHFTCSLIQFSIKSAICSLFSSSANVCPLPKIPTSGK
jgi:hypothetical protein